MKTLICGACDKAITFFLGELPTLPRCPDCRGRLHDIGQEVVTLSYPAFLGIENQKSWDPDWDGANVCKPIILGDNDVNIDELECEDILKRDPNNEEALIHLGKRYKSAGNIKKAEEFFKRAAAINPNPVVSARHLADIYLATRDYDAALDVLEALTKIEPDNAYLFYNLGIVYLQLDKPARAFVSLKQATHLTKDVALRKKIRRIAKIQQKAQGAI